MAFGTRYGSTAIVAEEIASVLREKGATTAVLDLRSDKGEGIEGYDLIVIGSGIIAGSWTKEAQRFLERNRGGLTKKRVALFACCGDLMFKKGLIEESRKRYLDDVAAELGIAGPVPMALFGGVLDFQRYGFLIKAILRNAKKGIEENGVDLSRPYDFRDWDAIRSWAGSLLPDG